MTAQNETTNDAQIAQNLYAEIVSNLDADTTESAETENLPKDETTSDIDESHEDHALQVIEREAVYENQASGVSLGEADTTESLDEDLDYADEVVSFDDLLGSVSDDDIEEMKRDIAEALSLREAYEADKNEDNATIQSTLKKARSKLVWNGAATVMHALCVNPAFINAGGTKRYNVYAIGKLADIVKSLDQGAPFENEVNAHIIRSLVTVLEAGENFTMELAKACVSDKIGLPNTPVPVIKMLSRRKLAPSTASTQASSTMQALETLGIVTGVGAKNPSYRFTTHSVVDAIKDIVKRAA